MTVSKICRAQCTLAPEPRRKKSFKIMDRALEMGINLFDTANVYGRKGRTEEIIGNWFSQQSWQPRSCGACHQGL